MLAYLFYTGVFLSNAWCNPTVSHSQPAAILGKPWNNHLRQAFQDELQHDLQWNDNVDGSYDIAATWAPGEQDEMRQPLKPPPTNKIKSHFRSIKNALAWAVVTQPPSQWSYEQSTPLSKVSGKKPHLWDHPQKFYPSEFDSANDPYSEPRSDEVEILLGTDVDVTPAILREEDDNDDNEAPLLDDDNKNQHENPREADEPAESREDKDDAQELVSPASGHPEAATLNAVFRAVPPQHIQRPPDLHIAGPLFALDGTAKAAEKREVAEKPSEVPSGRSLVLPIVFACTGSVVFGCIIATLFHKTALKKKRTFEENIIGYGVIAPVIKTSRYDATNDRLLAKAAETYHYQQQKHNALLSLSSSGGSTSIVDENRRMSVYEVEHGEEEDGDEFGDYTVYECPGLAPPGDLEVINPLFADQDDSAVEVLSDD